MTVETGQSQAREKREQLEAPRGIARLLQARELGVLVALIILCVIMTLASPYFLTTINIFNVLQGMSTIAIMAIGETMVLVAGGLDLSVGSALAIGAMFTARLMTYHGVSPWLAVLFGLLAGLAFGMVNGLIITRIKINAFITTLGMLKVGRGLTFLLATALAGTVASNIPMRDESVNFLGAGYIGKVPFAVIIMLTLVAVFSVFMAKTVLGRQIYAVGTNEQAARLSGVNVERVRLFTYMVMSGLAALAGIMNAGLLSTAATNLGEGDELSVIAAAIIGGTSMSGGEGTVYGALIGAAIMAVVRNAFVLLGLPLHLQTVTIGLVIVLAVGLDRFRRSQA
ncbi:MAG TPA: ABC transporter permease [Anaerolineae bacterium]|nr:ABC transporter permease [Anaerolineae bacterium]